VRARPAALLAALLVAAPLCLVVAQTVRTFSLKRDDTELLLSNLARAADGARSIGNNVNCEEGQRLTILYGPEPGLVETRVEEAILTSQLAVIRSPIDAEEGAGEETLELSDAVVTFNRPGCLEEVTPAEAPVVTLVQGQTSVEGSHFFLDRNEDVGRMEGPIHLTRESSEASGEPLIASATAMTFAVGEQRATLTGAVEVASEERVTTGETLELDEDAGTAVLSGSPARSVKGSDVLEGGRLLYYLDSDDVVVIGNVEGELEIELE